MTETSDAAPRLDAPPPAEGAPALVAAPPALPMAFVDIGVNLLDAMYDGAYHGKPGVHSPDRAAVVARAGRFGVEALLCTGGTLRESAATIAAIRELRATSAGAATFPRLFATVGCHPTRSLEFEASESPPPPPAADVASAGCGCDTPAAPAASGAAMGADAPPPTPAALAAADAYTAALDALIAANRDVVAAVGECGLDYDRTEFCPGPVQRRHLPRQLALARKHDLPLFLHMRAAAADFADILRPELATLPRGGVVHSFTGTAAEMRELVSLGLYIGVNGCSLKTPENLAAVAAVPLERLLLETDAPWCDLRATHASYAYWWPDDVAAAAAAARGGQKKGRAATPTSVATDAGAALSAPLPSWQALGMPPLPALTAMAKPEKWTAGAFVKGRNEPALVGRVFQVVYALRRAEVASPHDLAQRLRANAYRLFGMLADAPVP